MRSADHHRPTYESKIPSVSCDPGIGTDTVPCPTVRCGVYGLLQNISLCIVKVYLSSKRLATRNNSSSSTCREFFISPLVFPFVYRTAEQHFHQISSWHKMGHVTEPMDQHKLWYTVLLLSEQELASDLPVYGIARILSLKIVCSQTQLCHMMCI